MIAYFGLSFVLMFMTFLVTNFWGIPFTGIKGEYAVKEKDALREVNLVADLKKNELKQYLLERRGDALVFSESALIKRQTALLYSVVKQLKGQGMDNESLRTALIETTAYQDMLKHLSTMLSAYSTYQSATVIDAETGTVLVSTADNQLLQDFSGDKNFHRVTDPLEREVVDLFKGSTNSNSQLILYRAIMDGERDNDRYAVGAVLLLAIDLDEYIKNLATEDKRLLKTGEIIVVGNDQTLLSSLKFPLPDGTPALPFQYKLLTKPSDLSASGSEGIVKTMDYRGVPVLAAYRHLRINSEVGWGIIVEQEESEIYAQLRKRVMYYSLGSLLGCAVILVLATIIASRIARPIRMLTQTAGKVGEGDLTVRSPVGGFDEVGILSRSFNSMVESVQRSQEELIMEITAREKAQAELAKTVLDLSDALEKVKVLSGFLPICASCKKIRDDKGYWTQIESYISAHSEAQFSHGICQECMKKLYPDLCDENGNILQSQS